MAETQIMWDASELVKRYYEEAGRATVNAIFTAVASRDMFVTPLGYAETYSILLRKHNGGILDARAFVTATSALRVEVLEDRDFGLLSINDFIVLRQPVADAGAQHQLSGRLYSDDVSALPEGVEGAVPASRLGQALAAGGRR